MYVSNFFSNNMKISYCIRTVSITNVQLKTYKPITQRDLNVKLTLIKGLHKPREKNWFVGMGRISIRCFNLTTHNQLLNL
jgi:hypothetical protein